MAGCSKLAQILDEMLFSGGQRLAAVGKSPKESHDTALRIFVLITLTCIAFISLKMKI